MTSNLIQISTNQDRGQHSEFDIYPQKLIQTEEKLSQVEQRLGKMIIYLSSQRNQISNEIDKKKIEKATPNNILQNGSQAPLGVLKKDENSLLASMVNDQKKNGIGEVENKRCGLLLKQQSEAKHRLLEWLQFWVAQDQIDAFSQQKSQQTISFYERKIRQTQKMYKQMKDVYTNKIKQLQMNISTEKANNIEYPITYETNKNSVQNLTTKISNIQQSASNENEKDQMRTNESQKTVIESQIPTEYKQLLDLQGKIDDLKLKNARLQQRLVQFDVLNGKLVELDIKLKERDQQINAYSLQIKSLKAAVEEKDGKNNQLSNNLSAVQEKLQTKQKQLLKVIHSQSSFAAQQLTNLEAALIRQKEEENTKILEYTKKISELEQTVRQINFNLEKERMQINKLKGQLQQSQNKLLAKQALLAKVDVQKRQNGEIQATVFSQSQIDVINQAQQLQQKQVLQSKPAIQNKEVTQNQIIAQTQLKNSIKSDNSVASYLKKSLGRLKISHQVEIQHKVEAKQVINKTQQPTRDKEIASTYPKHKIDQFDILFEQECQQLAEPKCEQFKFTKVVSVKSNEPYDDSKADQNADLNMDILGQILLIPVDSLDQIQVGLERLKNKIVEYKEIMRTKDEKQLKAQTELKNSCQLKNTNEQELKLTGFPQTTQKIQQDTIASNLEKQQSQCLMQKLNKEIYQLAHQFSQLCKAVMQNFEQKIIKSQTKDAIEKIKNKKGPYDEVAVNKIESNFQKQNVNEQEKLKKETKQQVVQNIKNENIQSQTNQQAHIQNGNSENKIQNIADHLVLQSPEDYNKVLKLINNEIKKVFTTYFNDSKVLFDEQDQRTRDSTQIGSSDNISFDLFKQEDEKSTLDILRKVEELQKQLSKKRKQILQNNKERVERLFDVIRSMIITFKISFKSMNKIIEAKQMIDTKKNKYLLLRHYLTSLYKILEQESAIRVVDGVLDYGGHFNANQQTIQQGQTPSAPSFTLYENYQQKIEKLSSELSKVRLELDYKNKQFEQLKDSASNKLLSLGVPDERQKKSSSRNISDRQRRPSAQITQYLIPSSNEGPTQTPPKISSRKLQNGEGHEEQKVWGIEELKIALQEYKKKCSEYESQLVQNGKKKTQKIIYVRK